MRYTFDFKITFDFDENIYGAEFDDYIVAEMERLGFKTSKGFGITTIFSEAPRKIEKVERPY